MRISTLLMTVLLAAGLLHSQDKPAPDKPADSDFEAAIIPVKTLNGDSFNRLVRLLGVFNAKLNGDDKLRTIVVYAPKDVIAQIRRVVNDLDKPGSEAAIGRNIEMSLSFLRCSSRPSSEAGPLPPDLESVGKQLAAASLCKDVQLWDAMPIRLQEGKQTQSGSHLPGTNSPTVQMVFQPEAVVRKDNGRYVRFERMSMTFSGPGNQTMIQTAGDFLEGQKTVIGKVSGTDEVGAIFAVISLKILD
jgi:hypothetical protein